MTHNTFPETYEHQATPFITFDQMPTQDRLLVIHGFVNELQSEFTELKGGSDQDGFMTAAKNYSALVQLRATLWMEGLAQSGDESRAGNLAAKIIGEGMHILTNTGLSEADIRFVKMSDALTLRIQEEGPSRFIKNAEMQIVSLEEDIKYFEQEVENGRSGAEEVLAKRRQEVEDWRARLALYKS